MMRREPDSKPATGSASLPASNSVDPAGSVEASRPSSGATGILARGAFWTLSGYGGAQVIRFATSMALTRLLAPELFGIMLVVNTIRTGVELLSDVGIAQGVIRSPNGEKPTYYNTAWTLQILRGGLIALVCALAAIPISWLYGIPLLKSVLPVAALTLAVSGFNSMSLPLLRRRLDFRSLAFFEVGTAAAFATFQIGLAYFYPNVWALVIGLVAGSLITLAASFTLARGTRHALIIDRSAFGEIFGFGKWVTASSAIYFVTANFDRLYLPSVMALQTLGVYSIARTVVDIVSSVFVRLSNSILFPYVASRQQLGPEMLRRELAPPRIRFLGIAAIGVGGLAGSVDLLMTFLFDPRYHDAGTMASLLIFGGWFAVLAQTAEAGQMALGRPQVGTFSNGAKLVWLCAALPFAYRVGGTEAAIAAIAASDAIRYLVTIPAQRRSSLSFLVQDGATTLTLLATSGAVIGVRSIAGVALPAWL